MLVCQCNGVSDRTVRRVIQAGATSVGQVAQGCGAGACCGGCANAIRKLIGSEAGTQGLQQPRAVASLSESPARAERAGFGLRFSLLRRA